MSGKLIPLAYRDAADEHEADHLKHLSARTPTGKERHFRFSVGVLLWQGIAFIINLLSVLLNLVSIVTTTSQANWAQHLLWIAIATTTALIVVVVALGILAPPRKS